jgi:hypothetical protein
MFSLGSKVFIPFGCSCINQFQLDMNFGNSSKTAGLLDWTITTPEAAMDIMMHSVDGTLLDMLGDRNSYHREGPVGHLENRAIPGLYFWHENGAYVLSNENPQNFKEFVAKLRHKAKATFYPKGEVNLLWSNIQPNLELAILAETHRTIVDFFLSREIYERFSDLAQIVYPNSKAHFIAREEDCCPTLRIEPNVNINFTAFK